MLVVPLRLEAVLCAIHAPVTTPPFTHQSSLDVLPSGDRWDHRFQELALCSRIGDSVLRQHFSHQLGEISTSSQMALPNLLDEVGERRRSNWHLAPPTWGVENQKIYFLYTIIFYLKSQIPVDNKKQNPPAVSWRIRLVQVSHRRYE